MIQGALWDVVVVGGQVLGESGAVGRGILLGDTNC